MASLILINGAPGSGKSTLARLLIDEQPLVLLLDIDSVRRHLGQWDSDPQAAGIVARRLVVAMIRTDLDAGLDVIVPQFLFRSAFIEELERTAADAGGSFVEIALVSSPEEADGAVRCARELRRSESPGCGAIAAECGRSTD